MCFDLASCQVRRLLPLRVCSGGDHQGTAWLPHPCTRPPQPPCVLPATGHLLVICSLLRSPHPFTSLATQAVCPFRGASKMVNQPNTSKPAVDEQLHSQGNEPRLNRRRRGAASASAGHRHRPPGTVVLHPPPPTSANQRVPRTSAHPRASKGHTRVYTLKNEFSLML